jgi:DNA repair protein SbcD/Mre11
MRIKVVHTADVHIGMSFENASFSGDFSRIRHDEIKETFYNIVNYSKDIGADFLIIAGDLFENAYVKRSDLKDIKQLFQSLNKTEVILVTGNHDPLVNNSYYKSIEFSGNVHVFSNKLEKIVFPDKSTVIWGYSWDRNYVEYEIFKNIGVLDEGMINILVAHGDVFAKESKYLPIDKNELLKKEFDYIALGHIHKSNFIAKNMAYPGSPEPLDFGETGEHGFISGDVEKGNLQMKFIPFSKRQFIIKEIILNESMSMYDITNQILNCDTEENRLKNIYRIILDGIYDKDIGIDIIDIEEKLASYFKHIEIIDKSIPGYDLDRLKIENSDNLIGAFIKEMEALDMNNDINKNALRFGLEELLKNKEK